MNPIFILGLYLLSTASNRAVDYSATDYNMWKFIHDENQINQESVQRLKRKSPDSKFSYFPRSRDYKISLSADLEGVVVDKYNRLMLRLIFESTDEVTAYSIIRHYFAPRAKAPTIRIKDGIVYMYTKNRLDSIFGIKMLEYLDSANEILAYKPRYPEPGGYELWVKEKHTGFWMDLPTKFLFTRWKWKVGIPDDSISIPLLKRYAYSD